MEEFQNLLAKNRDLPDKEEDGKAPTGKFELHQVQRDSEGNERYIKTDEDDAIFKTKLADMKAKAAHELKDATFETRWEWIS